MKKYHVWCYDFEDRLMVSKFVKAEDEYKATSIVMNYVYKVLCYPIGSVGEICCHWR